ncbi:MAG TPA: hypothetical protein VJU15_14790 [Gemmatimonadales bacterium]|nr:hypothetical protein [Gemmatimonadales bacterium]
MNKLWLRIGLGAAFVFASGMFVVTLGRQVKQAVVGKMEHGGRFKVPLSMLPFEVNDEKVGTIESVDVQKSGHRVKQVRFVVKLSEPDRLAEFENCLFAVDGPRRDGFFSCIPEGSEEAADYRTVGEVSIEPHGLVRPLVVANDDAEGWFADSEGSAQEVNITANEGGAVIKVVDGNGNKVVQLTADSQGAFIRVKDANGNDVVNMKANAAGLDLKVKKDKP